jgi:hypothetical protein
MRLAWPTSPDDVWLVLDRNGNGLVDSGQELFGTATILSSGERAKHGYEALAELDTNGDQSIDSRDTNFNRLMVWRDAVRNGKVDRGEGELLTLARAGILALSTRYEESQRADEWGNAFRYRALATFQETPRRRYSWDVFLTVTEP